LPARRNPPLLGAPDAPRVPRTLGAWLAGGARRASGRDPTPRARGTVIVLDASAVVELLLRTDVGVRLADRLADPEVTLHAPHLLDVEVTQVMRRLVLARQLSEQRAAEALERLVQLDLQRYPHDLLVPRVWELRQNLSAYDATYVVLAAALDA